MTEKNLFQLLDIINGYIKEYRNNPESIKILLKIYQQLTTIISNLSNCSVQYDDTDSLRDKLKKRWEFELKRYDMLGSDLANLKRYIEVNILIPIKIASKLIFKLTEAIDNINNKKTKYAGVFERINPYLFAEIFATEAIPYSQIIDPIVQETAGFCYGHVINWAQSISNKGYFNTSTVLSAEIIQSNSCEQQIPFPFRDFFFPANLPKKTDATEFETINRIPLLRMLWNLLLKLSNDDIYFLSFHHHSTGIRRFGKNGIEYFDSNYGIFRFASKLDFLKFISIEILRYTSLSKSNLEFLKFSYHKLPFKNINSPDLEIKPIPVEKQKMALQECQSKLTNYACEHKERIKHILNLHNDFLHQTEVKMTDHTSCELLNNLIDKIKNEIKILQNKTNPWNPFIGSGSAKLKAKNIVRYLEIYTHYVNHIFTGGQQEKVCLLFALMQPYLNEHRDSRYYDSTTGQASENTQTYSPLIDWFYSNLLDMELAEKYIKNLDKFAADAEAHFYKQKEDDAVLSFLESEMKLAHMDIGRREKINATEKIHQLEEKFRRSAYQNDSIFTFRSKQTQLRYLAFQDVRKFKHDIDLLTDWQQRVILSYKDSADAKLIIAQLTRAKNFEISTTDAIKNILDTIKNVDLLKIKGKIFKNLSGQSNYKIY